MPDFFVDPQSFVGANATRRSELYYVRLDAVALIDATAGPRIKQLRDELEQLRAHHADLAHAAAHQPEPPTPGTVDALRVYLTRTIAAGTSGELKRAIEALVHEVRTTEHGMIPVFKIPSSGGIANQPDDDATATTTIHTTGSRNGAVGGAEGTQPLTPSMRTTYSRCQR